MVKKNNSYNQIDQKTSADTQELLLLLDKLERRKKGSLFSIAFFIIVVAAAYFVFVRPATKKANSKYLHFNVSSSLNLTDLCIFNTEQIAILIDNGILKVVRFKGDTTIQQLIEKDVETAKISPDSSFIVYIRKNKLYGYNFVTRKINSISNKDQWFNSDLNLSFLSEIVWAPSGNRFAFTAHNSENTENYLFTIELFDFSNRQLVKYKGLVSDINWLSDTKLIFVHHREGSSALLTIESNGANEVEILK